MAICSIFLSGKFHGQKSLMGYSPRGGKELDTTEHTCTHTHTHTHTEKCGKIIQFSSIIQSYPTLCDSIVCSMPGFPVHHQLLEIAQIHVH